MKKITFFLLTLLIIACQNTPKDLNEFKYIETTIQDLQKGYENGSWTIMEVVTAYSQRIATIDKSGPNLSSVIVINPDALVIADSLDKIAPENWGSLHGVPVLLKDNIDTKDKMATKNQHQSHSGPCQQCSSSRPSRKTFAHLAASATANRLQSYISAYSALQKGP